MPPPTTSLPDGWVVEIDLDTAYPVRGSVTVRVLSGSATPWGLTLRVPSGAEHAMVVVIPAGGGQCEVWRAGPGAVLLRRAWSAGDVVELDLSVEPRFTRPDRRIDAVRGCVAVERARTCCAWSRPTCRTPSGTTLLPS